MSVDTEVYEFRATVPRKQAPRAGAGRPAAPNPFTEAVARIAGKTQVVDGQSMPLAAETAFVLDAEHGETLKQRWDRIRRQLTAAGQEVAREHERGERYTIDRSPVEFNEAAGVYTFSFWDKYAGQ